MLSDIWNCGTHEVFPKVPRDPRLPIDKHDFCVWPIQVPILGNFQRMSKCGSWKTKGSSKFVWARLIQLSCETPSGSRLEMYLENKDFNKKNRKTQVEM